MLTCPVQVTIVPKKLLQVPVVHQVQWSPVPRQQAATAPQPGLVHLVATGEIHRCIQVAGDVWHLYVDGACPSNRGLVKMSSLTSVSVFFFVRTAILLLLLTIADHQENVQSTHHPAGWGVAIYLRAFWPQLQQWRHHDEVKTSLRLPYTACDMIFMILIDFVCVYSVYCGKWWLLYCCVFFLIFCCYAMLQMRPDKPLRHFCSLHGPVVLDASSPLSLGAELGSNNTAELSAFGEALLWLKDEEPTGGLPAVLHYDSTYAKKVGPVGFCCPAGKLLLKVPQDTGINIWIEARRQFVVASRRAAWSQILGFTTGFRWVSQNHSLKLWLFWLGFWCWNGKKVAQVAVGENIARKNQALAERVQKLWKDVSSQRKVDLEWVQGHSGDTGNEAWFNMLCFHVLSIAVRFDAILRLKPSELALDVLDSKFSCIWQQGTGRQASERGSDRLGLHDFV